MRLQKLSRIVLDASVVLAIIHQERGSGQLTPELLTTSAMSAVNLTEAHSKLFISGRNADEAWLDATSSGRDRALYGKPGKRPADS